MGRERIDELARALSLTESEGDTLRFEGIRKVGDVRARAGSPACGGGPGAGRRRGPARFGILYRAAGGRGVPHTLIWVDGGYLSDPLQVWLDALRPKARVAIEVVKRSDQQKGFVVQARRWVVERTFGWLNKHRRLSKDYERLPETSEAMIRVAMIRLMLARLAAE
jgi:transposase